MTDIKISPAILLSADKISMPNKRFNVEVYVKLTFSIFYGEVEHITALFYI